MNVMCACALILNDACEGAHWLILCIVQNEMMSDSIDDVLDDDQAEEETEELANQVIRCFFSIVLQ